MRHLQLNCGKCKQSLSFPLPEATIHSPCPACGTDIHVIAFPALIRESAPGRTGEALVVDEESSCFYHLTKKAEVACEACGRFMCSLCDIDFEGQHICPTCFEKGAQKGNLVRLEKGRTRYDDLALLLAILPVIFFCATILTAPAALFISIRYWNAPLSVVRKSRWRFVAAIIIAALQLLLWGFYAIGIFGAMSAQA